MLKNLVISLFLAFCSTLAFAAIRDYQPSFIPGYANESLNIAIRTYYRDDTLYFLVVDPHTLNTYEIPAAQFRERRDMSTITTKPTQFYSWEKLKASTYVNALLEYTQTSIFPMQNHNQGITHAQSPVEGLFLTIDLCPSTKPFEKEFFETLVALADEKKQPIPIGIAISGIWLIEHEEEFDWIVSQIKQNKLAVTWINHSFSHLYYGDLPAKENFLLFPFTNVPLEIFETEKMLLERDQIPSVFFRFPGLASNKEWMQALKKAGLIPIGSDAWLAAQQTATPGGIILVHGNSNEPEGIKLVMPLLKQKESNWLPLSHLFNPL